MLKNLKNVKILAVCLSSGWGVVERRFIKDARLLHEMSADVTYCISPLSEVSGRLGEVEIPFIRFKEEKRKIPFLNGKHTIKKELKEKNYDILIIYGETSLSSIPSAFRRTFRGVSFFQGGLDRTALHYSRKDQATLKKIDVKLALTHHQSIIYKSLEDQNAPVINCGLGLVLQMDAPIKQNLGSIITYEDLDSLEEMIKVFVELWQQQKLEFKWLLFHDRTLSDSLVKRIKDIIISHQAGEFVGIRQLSVKKLVLECGKLLIFQQGHQFLDYEVVMLQNSRGVIAPRSPHRQRQTSFYRSDERSSLNSLISELHIGEPGELVDNRSNSKETYLAALEQGYRFSFLRRYKKREVSAPTKLL